MKILMVSAETTPFAKTGGLGDMVAALAKALSEQRNDVRIVMPRYYRVSREDKKLLAGALGVPMGFGEEWCSVYAGTLPGTKVPVYFLDHEKYFGRAGLYGETGDSSYGDNAERFAFLSRGALQLCKKLNWTPAVVHAHDWQAGLVPAFLNTWERDGLFAATGSVYTVHNLAYQGCFPKDDVIFSQMDPYSAWSTGLMDEGGINFVRSALWQANVITTVSPTYSREIQTPEVGCGLDYIFRERSANLFGILNGVDYKEWSPETDAYIAPHNYTPATVTEKKALLKEWIQKEVGLPVNAAVPLFGMVTRFAEQKGLGALVGPAYGSLYRICTELNVQFVIAGTGEKWCEDEMRALDRALPNLSALIRFDNRLAHLIEAASDFFLMPSVYEPCGLNQMYSLKYGTLPIVRNTGGLADTVENYDAKTGAGTGFVFNDLNPGVLFDVCAWAAHAYTHEPEAIAQMRQAAMQQDFGWEKSAEKYLETYKLARTIRKGASR